MPSLRPLFIKAALISFATLCALPFIGQNLKYTASSQMRVTKSSHSIFSEFIGDDEQFVYVRTNKGFVNSHKNKIVIFDKKSMAWIREYELDSKNDSRVLRCFAARQTIYIFRVEKNEFGSQLTCEMLDPNFNNLGPKKTLKESPFKEFFISAKLNAVASEKIFFALVNESVNSETRKVDLHIQIIDGALSVIQDKTFELPVSLDLSDVGHEYVVHFDNLLVDGTVTVELSIRGQKQVLFGMNYQSNNYMYVYDYKQEKLIDSFEPKHPDTSKFYGPAHILSDGISTYGLGLHFEKEKAEEKVSLKNASGIYISPITADTTSSETIHLELTNEFVQQLMSFYPEYNGDLPLAGIYITYFKKDASGITLAFNFVSMEFQATYLGNIGIVHASTEGEIRWTSMINRAASSYSYLYPNETMIIVNDQTMFLVYNNDLDSQIKKDRKKKLKKEGYILDYATVDLKTGKTTQKELKISLEEFKLSDNSSYRDFQMDVCNNQIYIQSFEIDDKPKKKGYYLRVYPE